MTTNGNGVADFRDYVRVIFARAWLVAFITLAVMASVVYYSFYYAPKSYVAENDIRVTDKFSGALAKDMGNASDWTIRARRAELDLKRSVPAREIVEGAASAISLKLADADAASMANNINADLRLTYYKEGNFISLSYQAGNARLAAAVLSLFIKRMVESCVALQVGDLNNEVTTLGELKTRLSADVAASEKKLDAMRTVAPEMRLTASTMALLKSGQNLTTTPSTEQAVGVFLQLERDLISFDGEIADKEMQIAEIAKQLGAEPLSVPSQRRLDALPAIQEAMKKRDDLRLQMAQLMSNSTADHPMVKRISAELKALDAFLAGAPAATAVEVTYEPNPRRGELQVRIAQLQSDLAGVKERRAKTAENAGKWRQKLDGMPAEFRLVREATLDYDNKAQNLSFVTGRLIQAQIKRNLTLEQVGTYYTPQWEKTPVPSTYKNKHLIRLLLGFVLGIVASIFAVYAMEFADHSVRDQRDLKMYTKAAMIAVISDYNQLKSVASRAAWARAAGLKQYVLSAALVALAASLAWATWHNWPREVAGQELPQQLSVEGVANIEQAMKMYSSADLDAYVGAEQPSLDVVPAVEVPQEQAPQGAMSE